MGEPREGGAACASESWTREKEKDEVKGESKREERRNAGKDAEGIFTEDLGYQGA